MKDGLNTLLLFLITKCIELYTFQNYKINTILRTINMEIKWVKTHPMYIEHFNYSPKI